MGIIYDLCSELGTRRKPESTGYIQPITTVTLTQNSAYIYTDSGCDDFMVSVMSF